jgi:photosystem II stability/assembly factor-like uncharacterized protein
MISLSRIVALGCVGLMACGHGGGGGGEPDVVRLAVGDRVELVDGVWQERVVIFRSVGEEWTPVVEGLPDPGHVSSVFFASRDVAWAYGTRALRSTDGGRTWRDMVDRLDAALPEGRENAYQLRSMAFADADTGYFAAYSIFPSGFPDRGPFVWSTRDGGDNWSEVVGVGQTNQEVGFMLNTRAGAPELLRHPLDEGTGAIVQALDDVTGEPIRLTSLPAVVIEGFDAVGTQGWVAITVIPGDDFADARPAIFTSDAPGAPWRSQSVPDEVVMDFGTLDMCDANVGIAAGKNLFPSLRTFVYWTDDGGTEWRPSVVPNAAGFELTSLLCVSATEILVAGTRDSANGFATELYESRDGGKTFAKKDVTFDAPTRLLGLASNADFQ